jgi:dolichol-phosphate mannosyltransferase
LIVESMHPPVVRERRRLLPSGGSARRALGFAAVGASGILLNSLALWFFADPAALGLNYVLGAILATQVSTTWNFVLIDTLVYRGPKQRRTVVRYLIFSATNNLVLLARVPVLAFLVTGLHVNYLVANALTLALSFVVRFATSDRLIYRLEKS